jgi:TPP-dependent pyruvate/acetoin dehydrogenase alpha subunit
METIRKELPVLRGLDELELLTAEELYRRMFLIRSFEEELLQLFSDGKLFGTTHTSIGQEAIAVGVIAHMSSDDVIFSNHRCHGHYLAYSDDVEGLLAEIMGRATGVCGGKGGSQHIHAGNFYTNGVLGGTVACAAGMALAEQRRGSNARVAVFVGDGALGEGVIYETFNIAALWSIPILFVVENNFYAQSTPSHLELAGRIIDRPLAFGIQSAICRPASVEEAYLAAGDAWAYIAQNCKPFCLVFETYRFAPHSTGDDFRPAEEIMAWRERDPLRSLAEQLEPSVRAEIERAVRDRIERAVAASGLAPYPDVQSIGW